MRIYNSLSFSGGIYIRYCPASGTTLWSRWSEVQECFVDDPAQSIRDADRLVCDLMLARGDPMSEFEHRGGGSFRELSARRNELAGGSHIALRHENRTATTEDLRYALYRDLFDELLEAHASAPREKSRCTTEQRKT
jgi:hypothetical protein